MGCGVLGSPRPRGEAFQSSFGFRFCSQPKNKRGETQHRKRHSQLPPKQLTSACSPCSAWKGRNQTEYTNAGECSVHQSWRMRSPRRLPLPAMGMAGAQALAPGISHTCFASSCLSSSNLDCTRISQRFLWQSTHICFSTPRASPSEI